MHKEVTVEDGARVVKAFNKCIKWIVEESCEDICQLCVYYDKDISAEELDELEKRGICCRQQAEYGKRACYDGLKAYFERVK